MAQTALRSTLFGLVAADPQLGGGRGRVSTPSGVDTLHACCSGQLRRIPVAAPVPPQLVLMVQGRSETLVVWGAKPRRGQERLRKGQESPRNGQESPGEPRRGPGEFWISGGAGPATRGVKSLLRSTSWEPKNVPERCFGHPRCQIFVEVDILEPKRCTRTVFWAPEVSDLR